MAPKPVLCFLIYLFTTVACAQQVEWVKHYTYETENYGNMKLDSQGNIFLVNTSDPALSNGIITKLNSAGEFLWDIKLQYTDYKVQEFRPAVNFTLDSEGNFYGIIDIARFPDITLVANNGTFPVGLDFNIQHFGHFDEVIIILKISKDGAFEWSKGFHTFGHSPGSYLTIDENTNTLYNSASYYYFLNSARTTLNTLATSHKDMTPVAYICALDAATGEEKMLKNLATGGPGQIVPLPDRLSYLHPNFALQLTLDGDILQHKPLSTNVTAHRQYGTDVNLPFFYEAGRSMQRDPVYGSYDPHNKIRILDLYGDMVAEKEFSYWDDLYQRTGPVFRSIGIQSIDHHNVVALVSGMASNFERDAAPFDGEMLTERDLWFVFFDSHLNIRKKYAASSSAGLNLVSLQYDKQEEAFYALFETRAARSITIGQNTIQVNDGKRYMLIKLRFEDLELAPAPTGILSFLISEQISTAHIDHSAAAVTTFVGPGTDLTKLNTWLYLPDNTTLKKPLPQPLDLSLPKKITLVNEAGQEREWTLAVNKKFATENELEHLEFPGQLSLTKDSVRKEIEVMVSRTLRLENLSLLDFHISEHATVAPDPFSLTDFSQPQQLTITAENGEEAVWNITVKRKLSNENNILDFQVKDQLSATRINDINNIIELELALFADWKNTIEKIHLSPGAELMLPPNEPLDFSGEVQLLVQAEDGHVATWRVLAKKAAISALAQAVQVYPVPANGILTIDLHFLAKSPLDVELTSIEGRQVYHRQLAPAPFTRASLALTSYPSGIYLLRLRHANQVYVQKILIQH